MTWVVEIENEVKNKASASMEDQWTKHSIYKVPAFIAEVNKKPYKPQIVSFGPYHHGGPHLKAMEDHKHRSLLHFLGRSKQPIGSIFDSLAEVVQTLKDSYDTLGPPWSDDDEKFLQLMIVDGVFMLEVLRTASSNPSNDYLKNDPIFSDHGRLYFMPFIKRDMLMLENQLPMLVLDKLAATGVDDAKEDDEFINRLILEFCGFPLSKIGKRFHVLDVVRESMLRDEQPKTRKTIRKTGRHPIENGDAAPENDLTATELHEAGVHFRRSPRKTLKDISFDDGILRLPSLVIDDNTEATFLNLIAFERLHVGIGNAITSYLCFMDSMIDTGKDVSFLQSRKILSNVMGSHKDAAKLFNTMTKDLAIDPDSELGDVHWKVNQYCKQPWHTWRANLIHTYFRSPWSVISVLAAIFLFGLTIVQTIYSVFSVDDPSDPPSN